MHQGQVRERKGIHHLAFSDDPLQFSARGMDPKRLKAEYGRSLCFYGGVDIQHTLPYGITGQVRSEVRERVEVLGKGGGYILGPAHSLMDDVPVANVLAMYDEARRHHSH